MLLRLLIGFAAMGCTAVVTAQTRPANPEADQEEVRLSAGTDAEYQSLLNDLALDDATRTSVQEKIDQRRARLLEFVEGDQGKQLEAKREGLRQARIKKDNERVSAIRREIQPLSDQYWALRQDTRRDILKALNEEQLQQYVGLVLSQRLTRPLARIELTEKQQTKIRAMANEKAAVFVNADTISTDPFFRGLEPLAPELQRQVMDTILTPKQRIQLRERRSTSAPATSQPAARP